MKTIYKSTSYDANGIETTAYYTERKVTKEEYNQEFGHGKTLKSRERFSHSLIIPALHGQKLITVRDYLAEGIALAAVKVGAKFKYKN